MKFADALVRLLEDVFAPNRFVIEANVPDILSAAEQSAQQLGGGAVDGGRRDQAAVVRDFVATSPCNELRNVVASDSGERFHCAEVVNDPGQIAFSITSAGMVLASLVPITASGIIKRHARAIGRRRGVLDPLAFGLLYRLRFPPVCPLRRAVKAITSPLEVEVVVRRALGLID